MGYAKLFWLRVSVNRARPSNATCFVLAVTLVYVIFSVAFSARSFTFKK